MYDIIWVCDRGSNLKKALAKFNLVHCVGHRLNNTLQKIFYQAETAKAKKDVAFGDFYLDIVEDDDDQLSGSSSGEDEDECDDDEKLVVDKRTRSINYSSTTGRSNATTTLAQLPSDAKRILVTIIHCKELVRYIKKVNSIQEYLFC
jgi:hypothetical protein